MSDCRYKIFTVIFRKTKWRQKSFSATSFTNRLSVKMARKVKSYIPTITTIDTALINCTTDFTLWEQHFHTTDFTLSNILQFSYFHYYTTDSALRKLPLDPSLVRSSYTTDSALRITQFFSQHGIYSYSTTDSALRQLDFFQLSKLVVSNWYRPQKFDVCTTNSAL